MKFVVRKALAYLFADASCVLCVHLPWLIKFFDPVLISKQSDCVCAMCVCLYVCLISIRLFMVGGEGMAWMKAGRGQVELLRDIINSTLSFSISVYMHVVHLS